MSSADILFGCHHPESKPISSDSVIFFCKYVCEDKINGIFYVNGREHPHDLKDYDSALLSYSELLKKGWLPMSVEDIQKSLRTQYRA